MPLPNRKSPPVHGTSQKELGPLLSDVVEGPPTVVATEMVGLPLHPRPDVKLLVSIAAANSAEIIQLTDRLSETQVEFFVGFLSNHHEVVDLEQVSDTTAIIGRIGADRCSPADGKQTNLDQASLDGLQCIGQSLGKLPGFLDVVSQILDRITTLDYVHQSRRNPGSSHMHPSRTTDLSIDPVQHLRKSCDVGSGDFRMLSPRTT